MQIPDHDLARLLQPILRKAVLGDPILGDDACIDRPVVFALAHEPRDVVTITVRQAMHRHLLHEGPDACRLITVCHHLSTRMMRQGGRLDCSAQTPQKMRSLKTIPVTDGQTSNPQAKNPSQNPVKNPFILSKRSS